MVYKTLADVLKHLLHIWENHILNTHSLVQWMYAKMTNLPVKAVDPIVSMGTYKLYLLYGQHKKKNMTSL